MRLIMKVIWWSFLLLLASLELFSEGQVTRVTRSERLLRRQRRYLSFPTGSNLVLTMILVKRLLQLQPQGWNMLLECDVPFPLPNDTRIIFSQPDGIRKRQRREVYVLLEEAFHKAGLQGNSCLKQLICDAQDYVLGADKAEKSLVRDILSAIFTVSEDQEGLCENSGLLDCELPFFRYILGSLTNTK